MAATEPEQHEATGSSSSAGEGDQLGVALNKLLEQAERKGSIQTSMSNLQAKKKQLLAEKHQVKKEEKNLKRQRQRLQKKCAAKLSSDELLQVLVIQSKRETQKSASSKTSARNASEEEKADADNKGADEGDDRAEA